MDKKPIVVTADTYPRALNIVGEHCTVLASGAATGSYEIFLQQGPEGSGPPPHHHPWDEAFFVTVGQIEFGIGTETMTASAGTLVHLPAGTRHWFRFAKGGGQMVSMTSRAGAAAMFTELDREIAPDRPDLEKLAAIGARHGMTAVV